MANKIPVSYEWMARNIDITAGFSSGTREQENKYPAFSIWVTLPPFADTNMSDMWRRETEDIIIRFGGEKISSLNVTENDMGTNRVQYLISGKGGWKECEDMLLNSYKDNIGTLMKDEIREEWIEKLKESAPTSRMKPSPSDICRVLKTHVEKIKEGTLKDNILSILQNVIDNDNYSVTVLDELKAYETNVKSQANEICKYYTEALTALTSNRNNMRMKFEEWMSKVFLPLSEPYFGVFSDMKDNTDSIYDQDIVYRRTMNKVFHEDASKCRMLLEGMGVQVSKVFPMSPYHIKASAPFVFHSPKTNETVVKINWLTARLHWKLTNNFIEAMQTSPLISCSVSENGRKVLKNDSKYNDPYGLNEIYSKTLTVLPLKDVNADNFIGYITDKLFKTGMEEHKYELSEAEIKEADAIISNVIEKSDIISAKKKELSEEKEERQNSMTIENRVMPMPQQSSIYIQRAYKDNTDKKCPALLAAIEDTLEEYPEWTRGNCWVNEPYKYEAFYLTAPYTSEASGLACRSEVARFVCNRATEITARQQSLKAALTKYPFLTHDKDWVNEIISSRDSQNIRELNIQAMDSDVRLAVNSKIQAGLSQKDAISETLKEMPERKLDVLKAMIALHVQKNSTELINKREVVPPVEFKQPNTGYKIEVGIRAVNIADKSDETKCLYIKIPSAVNGGGKLYKQLIKDKNKLKELHEKDPVSYAFYRLSKEFGENSPEDNILKTFELTGSINEHYTKTFNYILENETMEEDIEIVKETLTKTVGKLFEDLDVKVKIDWMPDTYSKKMEQNNKHLNVYIKAWEQSKKERESSFEPEYADSAMSER